MGSLGESMTGDTTMKGVIEKELGEEVLAAALSQGKPPSMLAMVTGAALINLVKPASSKALPKRFLLAATPGRVVALKGTPISDDDDRDTGDPEGKGDILKIPGTSIPVFDRTLGSDRERELFEVLSA